MNPPLPSVSPEPVDPRTRPSLNAEYAGDARGKVPLYVGPLVLTDGAGTEETVHGAITLDLHPRTKLVAHVPKGDPWSCFGNDNNPGIDLPPDARLCPASEDALPPLDKLDQVRLNRIESGSARTADRFLFHINGPLRGHMASYETERGWQQQHEWTLPGWNLRLARVDQGELGFNHVLEAVPAHPVNADAVGQLRGRLFLLLSFIAGREIGVGPICGVNGTDVVYAEWGAPRVRYEPPGLRWCSHHLFAPALDSIAVGYAALDREPGLQAVIDRGINFLLTAGGSEVLDVRVPMACAGLELVAWGTLLRRTDMTPSGFKQSKGTVARALLEWAHIPIDLPDHFTALRSRSTRLPEDRRSGPHTLFNLRNALVHPPKDIDDPDWPRADELLEAWQLATWYLELVILRVLGYGREVQSRLVLGQWEGTVEPVPWAL